MKIEEDEKRSKAENDEQTRIKTAEKDKADQKLQKLRLGVEIGAIVLPIIFYSVWMVKGLKFEEDGTFTSTMFRNLFGKFNPTK